MTGCPPWPPDLRRPAGTTALLAATRKIPVVFMQVNDPVEQGFVASLAHPADNTTGFTQMSAELDPKRLQLLHDIAPSLSRAHLLSEPSSHAGSPARVAQAEAAAKTAPRGNRRQTSLLPKHTSMPNRPAMTAHEGRVELLSALASGRVGVVTITESASAGLSEHLYPQG